MSRPTIRIVQILPAHTAFYVVFEDGGSWFMERVRVWCIVERSDDGCQWVSAVGKGVNPILDPIHSYQPGNEIFIAGDDLAPDGRCWREVYNDPPPGRHRIKDVTAMMSTASPF